MFTIHNLGYQGNFPGYLLRDLGLNAALFHPQGLEFWGELSFLKAGIVWSDAVTTVSPTYAQEIQTPEYGHGLDGVLRDRADKITGILNGVDYARVESRDRSPPEQPLFRAEIFPESAWRNARCSKR